MQQNLLIEKQILKKVKNLNLYGNEYTEIELSDVDDEIS
jgi:predicted transport protein